MSDCDRIKKRIENQKRIRDYTRRANALIGLSDGRTCHLTDSAMRVIEQWETFGEHSFAVSEIDFSSTVFSTRKLFLKPSSIIYVTSLVKE